MTDPKLTPPPELVEQWMQVHSTKYDLARQAARWGADQELEACIGLLVQSEGNDAREFLRAARRSKPPSLKEQALDELVAAERLYPADWSTIRRALEALPND
jgi:hypothetical protein